MPMKNNFLGSLLFNKSVIRVKLKINIIVARELRYT